MQIYAYANIYYKYTKQTNKQTNKIIYIETVNVTQVEFIFIKLMGILLMWKKEYETTEAILKISFLLEQGS